MNKKKIYVIGTSHHYTRFLSRSVFELTDNIEEADVVMLTGGEDVTPSLYHAERHPYTGNNPRRDDYEIRLLQQVRKDQLVVGICRGSQLSCVVNGGKLVQHCNNHGIAGTHGISKVSGRLCDSLKSIREDYYEITSTHHQMQYPYLINPDYYDILFISSENRCTTYQGDFIEPEILRRNGEPEVVLYHVPGKPRYLAIQGHPEMIPESVTSSMLQNLIYELITQ